MENGIFAGRIWAQSRRLGLQNLTVGVQNSFDSMSVELTQTQSRKHHKELLPRSLTF